MSDDIFKDIWQKLADIYSRITSAISGAAASAASARQPGVAGSGMSAIFARLSGALGGAFSKLAGILSKLALTVGIVTAALSLLVKTVHSATKAQLEQQRELSKMNAAIARSFAVSDVLDMFREGRLGSGTSASTERLNEAFTKLKDSLVPMRAAWTNLVNKSLSLLNKIVTPIINVLSAVVTPLLNLTSAIVDLPDRIYNAVADVFKTDEERRKAEEDRRRQRAIGDQGSQLPVARMFNNVLQRDWAAVTDSRKPLF